MRCAEGGSWSIPLDVVDIFDARNGRWSTAVLSVARSALAATSLPNQGLAIFAGGTSAYFSVCLCRFYVLMVKKGGFFFSCRGLELQFLSLL
jgi:hypothetical protein